jgi:hypothetical protein
VDEYMAKIFGTWREEEGGRGRRGREREEGRRGEEGGTESIRRWPHGERRGG